MDFWQLVRVPSETLTYALTPYIRTYPEDGLIEIQSYWPQKNNTPRS